VRPTKLWLVAFACVALLGTASADSKSEAHQAFPEGMRYYDVAE
jgi:hypothetical protein